MSKNLRVSDDFYDRLKKEYDKFVEDLKDVYGDNKDLSLFEFTKKVPLGEIAIFTVPKRKVREFKKKKHHF